MKFFVNLLVIYSLMITTVFGQATNPNNTLKVGNPSSASDKGIIFDTNDGANNKKLIIEKISKKLKFDGNSVQLGDGSSSSDKELIIAGALKSLKYNGTTGEFEFNDDLKLSGELKSDILRAINTEVAVKSTLRAEQNLKIGTGANEIRVSGGNLEFSNDGALYKKIGSGSGTGGSGGTLILENASFEDGLTPGWTSSGGTFTQETYTNSVEGNTKFARFVATTSGQYFETTAKAIPDFFSGGCQADFKKVTVSADDLFKVEVLDASLNVLTSANVKKSTQQKFPTIGFTCPAAGTLVKMRVTSLAAGTIDADEGYLGSNQNTVNVAQAKLMGTVTITGCTSSWVGTSTSWASFPVQSNCVYTTTGQALSPTTQLPAIKFSTLPAGDYRLEYEGFIGQVTAGNNAFLQFSDGTNTARENSSFGSSGSSGHYIPGISQSISYATTQNNVTLELKYKVTGGSVAVYGQTLFPGTIKVWHFPSSSETAVNPEQASWLIDANIGGGNATLDAGAISSYAEALNSTLDMVLNNGSATAQIACASGNDSTGLTCAAGSEVVGITFTNPTTGMYEACFDYSVNTQNVTVVHQLMETTPTSSTIVQEGKVRSNVGSGGAGLTSEPAVKTCGYFTFSDVKRRTIRLMYEKSSGAALLIADRTATLGQRDVHITIRPLLSAYNRPILSGDQVTTRGANNTEFFSVSFGTTNFLTPCTSSSCLIDQIGNSVSSIIRASVGDYTIYFTKTYSKVKCNGVFNNLAGTGAKGITDGATNLSCSNCNSLKMDTGVQVTSRYDTFGTVLCHAQP